MVGAMLDPFPNLFVEKRPRFHSSMLIYARAKKLRQRCRTDKQNRNDTNADTMDYRMAVQLTRHCIANVHAAFEN